MSKAEEAFLLSEEKSEIEALYSKLMIICAKETIDGRIESELVLVEEAEEVSFSKGEDTACKKGERSPTAKADMRGEIDGSMKCEEVEEDEAEDAANPSDEVSEVF